MEKNYYLLTNLLSEEETRVVNSMIEHIERGEKRVGIQQIANENYISTTFIMKMCKRLGFDGYSELYYHLCRQLNVRSGSENNSTLQSQIDNYSQEQLQRFCALLYQSRRQKMFTTGEGFSDIVCDYMVQRLSICGFLVFNNVHFYDYMLFQKEQKLDQSAPEASVMFAVSQSGETEPVINDVRYAKQQGYKIISFTKRDDSALAGLSDIVFVVDGSKQTLVGGLPNRFFGHVILAFEELIGCYFSSFLPGKEKK